MAESPGPDRTVPVRQAGGAAHEMDQDVGPCRSRVVPGGVHALHNRSAVARDKKVGAR
jgi:hypothetical protein